MKRLWLHACARRTILSRAKIVSEPFTTVRFETIKCRANAAFFGVISSARNGRPSPSCCGRYVYECCSRLQGSARRMAHKPRRIALRTSIRAHILWNGNIFWSRRLSVISADTNQRSERARRRSGTSLHPTMGAANIALLGGRQFQLWHNPDSIILRSQRFFQGGFHENVVASNKARLKMFSDIRHRIVHAQADAIKQFQYSNDVTGRHAISRRAPRTFLARLELRYNCQEERWLEKTGLELGRASSPNRLTPDRSDSELLPVSRTPSLGVMMEPEVGYGTAQPICPEFKLEAVEAGRERGVSVALSHSPPPFHHDT